MEGVMNRMTKAGKMLMKLRWIVINSYKLWYWWLQGNGLGDFEAPKWKGNIAKGESNSAETAEQMQSAKVDEEGGLVLKRRKVDIQEEDD